MATNTNNTPPRVNEPDLPERPRHPFRVILGAAEPTQLFPVTAEAYLRFLISRPPQARRFAEMLIDELDRLDSDPDLEEHDEPSLGSLDDRMDQRGWSHGGTRDLEGDCREVGAQS